jgi:hypothetical protein
VLGGQKLKLKRAVPPVKGERKPAPRRAERSPIDRPYADRPGGDRPAMDRLGIERPTLSASRERFPAMAPQEPPRKVIVEYRNRRGVRTITG